MQFTKTTVNNKTSIPMIVASKKYLFVFKVNQLYNIQTQLSKFLGTFFWPVRRPTCARTRRPCCARRRSACGYARTGFSQPPLILDCLWCWGQWPCPSPPSRGEPLAAPSPHWRGEPPIDPSPPSWGERRHWKNCGSGIVRRLRRCIGFLLRRWDCEKSQVWWIL